MSATTDSCPAEAAANDHAHCLLCGGCNPLSLRLSFEDRGNTVHATFQARPILQGYTGILHGGVVASLLDSAMTHCLFHHGVQGVTGDLHIRFVLPVRCDETIDVSAWILSATEPLYRLRAELHGRAGLMAWAEGKFMRRRGTR